MPDAFPGSPVSAEPLENPQPKTAFWMLLRTEKPSFNWHVKSEQTTNDVKPKYENKGSPVESKNRLKKTT